jgi:hypothetical protein
MALLSWVMLPRVPEVLKYQEGISDTLASFWCWIHKFWI